MKRFTTVLCCSKNNSIAIILNAIFWAALILLCAAMGIQWGSSSMTVTGLLTAGWFSSQMVIRGKL